MQTTPTDDTHNSLADTLENIHIEADNGGPSIGELADAVGDKGFGVLLMLLALPSALPIPAPGYSIPFGIAMAIIAAQIFIGRQTIWLPKRIMAFRVHPKLASKMLRSGAGFLRRVETLIKPRLRWMHSKAGHSALAVIIFIMAVFMMIPIPGTNTMPAMSIFIIGVSMSEEDGFIAIGAIACAILAATISGVVLYLFCTQGPEAADGAKEWIKAQLGMEPTSH
ncbi:MULTISPECIES: exopolysaccharide biosynthesis protein [unclassified Lentimonas]|uniref:exopolysaccharide biosynthesis protein n=1 Tax=unclassified Lentimonas TaxID=2630993 RepID=UPI001328D265|nr:MULTISPECIES: exopolysaccharide biosynthesis protein [unclassified Lentimonas]CAA6678515.1 Unannotated [Lentimonas sp. CC4]CAA6685747.1 Unannotated [Lentimonas sp. CC6]CAA6695127.1 Unannotated [Lentimonas sp. CC19]CAA6697235.1 Unannotated [Lentimonas sp. CC10]CAA7070462.1 Unannotated [Lentimonas sp. CC11]